MRAAAGIFAMFVFVLPQIAAAAVDYDAGIMTIKGVQVFRDAADPNSYYYLPQYPRVSANQAGDFQLLLLKHVGGSDEKNGGIFHALIEFTLPPEVISDVAAELERLRPGSKLIGALPLLQAGPDDPVGSFRVISATLDPDAPPDRLTGRVIMNGPAPLYPGSRAALAARLSQSDATILMESLTGATSDISVAIRGYYEATVAAYNAVVTADMDTVYRHRSVVDNLTKGFSKREARQVVDQLHQDGAIVVKVHDRSVALNVKAEDLQKVLDIVTNKLLEVMFNTETGWSKEPKPEVLLAQDQIKGRQEKGWFGKIFGGPDDLKYYTDDQYVLKNREDVRSNSFYLNLSKATTIRLPFDSTGNIGGFYDALSASDRAKYFRVIALDQDIDLQSQPVFFQVDGSIAEGFATTFNTVSVNVRSIPKAGANTVTKSLVFDAASMGRGNGVQSFTLFRLGDTGDAWRTFEYQVAWNVRGRPQPLRQPAQSGAWIRSSDASVTLSPPLQRQSITLIVDSSEFEPRGIAAGVIQLLSVVDKRPQFVGEVRVRAAQADPSRDVVIFHDPAEDVAYRVIWHTKKGSANGKLTLLQGGLAVVAAPPAEWIEESIR